MDHFHYWGAQAIAKRLGYRDGRSVTYAHKQLGLPVIRRRRTGHPRLWLYTNERLVSMWELAVAQAQREQSLGQAKGTVRGGHEKAR